MFNEDLMFGLSGEKLIANWLRFTCGYDILPILAEENAGKGPRLHRANGEDMVVPDMLAIRDGHIRWIECKRKNSFAWYRIGKCWTTGIDLAYYRRYRAIAEYIGWPVYLMFLQQADGAVNDYGDPAPSGLFTGEILYLGSHIDHKHTADSYGVGGMVYWRMDTLKHIASLDDVHNANRQSYSIGKVQS